MSRSTKPRPWLDRPCPRCRAGVGEECVALSGEQAKTPHSPRLQAQAADETRLPVPKVVELLAAELDSIADQLAENNYPEGNAYARWAGRAGGLALAIGMLTGVDADSVIAAAEERAAERSGRLADAMEMVLTADGLVLRRPWCDCANRRGFTKADGVWVRACCRRPEKHYWLKHGHNPPSLAGARMFGVSTGKARR